MTAGKAEFNPMLLASGTVPGDRGEHANISRSYTATSNINVIAFASGCGDYMHSVNLKSNGTVTQFENVSQGWYARGSWVVKLTVGQYVTVEAEGNGGSSDEAYATVVICKA